MYRSLNFTNSWGSNVLKRKKTTFLFLPLGATEKLETPLTNCDETKYFSPLSSRSAGGWEYRHNIPCRRFLLSHSFLFKFQSDSSVCRLSARVVCILDFRGCNTEVSSMLNYAQIGVHVSQIITFGSKVFMQ